MLSNPVRVQPCKPPPSSRCPRRRRRAAREAGPRASRPPPAGASPGLLPHAAVPARVQSWHHGKGAPAAPRRFLQAPAVPGQHPVPRVEARAGLPGTSPVPGTQGQLPVSPRDTRPTQTAGLHSTNRKSLSHSLGSHSRHHTAGTTQPAQGVESGTEERKAPRACPWGL